MVKVSTVTAVPTASDIVGVRAVDGVLAVANVPASRFLLSLAILLFLLEC
jgi:hypothetical protein